MRLDRIRVPVPDLPRAAESYGALGFHLVENAAHTPTGALELVPGTHRPEIVLSTDAPVADLDDQLPLKFERSSRSVPPDVAHPNTVLRLERVYIVTPYVDSVVESYTAALGLAHPAIQRGTVIRANMAVFDVGPVGIGVATPFEDGPAAEALQRNGPGVFQALFRVSSMARAAALITSSGLPAPSRGTRNNGEQALLIAPEYAAGLYIALVGPE